MAEDEAAENNLIEAIERVDKMSWPITRHKVLSRALHRIAYLLHFDIVKVEPPVASAGSDTPSTPAPENPNGKQ